MMAIMLSKSPNRVNHSIDLVPLRQTHPENVSRALTLFDIGGVLFDILVALTLFDILVALTLFDMGFF